MTVEENKSYEEIQLEKLNEQMAKLAAKKRKLREAQKKKDEKKRKASIYAIGEFFEHLEILNLDKNVILGALVELAKEKDNQERMDALSMIGLEEMEKLETKKASRKAAQSQNSEE